MKKLLLIILLLLVLICGCTTTKEEKEIHAYVGAGMQKPMDEIGKLFEEKYGVKVKFDYAGSGYLYAKILATKEGDIFMPGAYFYVEKLKEKGYILKYANLTKHIPVIVVKKGNPKHIEGLEDLAKPNIKLAVGDEHIAIGRAFKKIMEKFGKDYPTLKEKIEKNIVVKGATVNQVLLYVAEGDADAGIVWKSSVTGYENKVDVIQIEPKYNVIKTVPIAILKTTKDKEDAEKFYNFVLTEGKKIFKKYGFEVIE
ncbi:molybdenum ABC transporter, periplasmic molybdate-binding protein [Methanocaldococcus infernus ME]|uniref:Molybdenum ABC transporter, periplasmic molybdate-binding protein n=1 Tax=Methanocaldococcus infernus (strain DSM 11812 / JCM 15783 / ME) TaxID=573063 RepID=D5VQK0_METIM|nr:molybdate ABC transporter substrate-binding protein [Methanocaldococcus infernus]ADG12853.1 molybdenum ABC transporter, periplasmic molybdate-binding protein [Methanocaldococcus infernus ME]